MEERYIQTPGGRIWSCVYGKEKEKMPILVVHGGPGFLTMTDTIKDFSSERPVISTINWEAGNPTGQKIKIIILLKISSMN